MSSMVGSSSPSSPAPCSPCSSSSSGSAPSGPSPPARRGRRALVAVVRHPDERRAAAATSAATTRRRRRRERRDDDERGVRALPHHVRRRTKREANRRSRTTSPPPPWPQFWPHSAAPRRRGALQQISQASAVARGGGRVQGRHPSSRTSPTTRRCTTWRSRIFAEVRGRVPPAEYHALVDASREPYGSRTTRTACRRGGAADATACAATGRRRTLRAGEALGAGGAVGLMDGWPALERWTDEYLVARLGNVNVVTSVEGASTRRRPGALGRGRRGDYARGGTAGAQDDAARRGGAPLGETSAG